MMVIVIAETPEVYPCILKLFTQKLKLTNYLESGISMYILKLRSGVQVAFLR